MVHQGTQEAPTPDLGLDSISDLSLSELRSLWQRHYPDAPPKRMSRELMARAIAYKLQEKASGCLSRRTKAMLKAYADSRFRYADAKSQRSTVTIKPGTQLVRQWGGRVHTVTAANNGGFVYGDQHYRSLSQIARTITGTRWSGPVFFGLKTHLVEEDTKASTECTANAKRGRSALDGVPS